jgi:hypothetical protein
MAIPRNHLSVKLQNIQDDIREELLRDFSESPDLRLVDDWVDSIDSLVLRADEVRSNISVQNYDSEDELYSAVNQLADSIDSEVVEPYWDSVCWEIPGYDRFDQIFHGRNFAGERDREYVREVEAEAIENSDILNLDSELYDMVKEERFTPIELLEAYGAVVNVLEADERPRSDFTSGNFRDYHSSGL